MDATIRVPRAIADVVEEPVERSVLELVAVGLYRDGKMTLRQAAELIGMTMKGMLEVLAKHSTYITYGTEELDEDVAYASGGQ